MSFVERLHPRDGDGKFAHTAGAGSSAVHVVSRQRGGPTVTEQRAGRTATTRTATTRTSAAPTAGGAGNVAGTGDGPWSGSGLRHVGTINGREYHLKRAGGTWSVYRGDPSEGRKVATAATIGEAKAAAVAHAGGGSNPPPPDKPKVTPPPVKPAGVKVPPADAKESVRTSSRQAGVSPTTAAKIRKAREGIPDDTDGWHEAAVEKPNAATVKTLAAAEAKAQKSHDANVAKMGKIRTDYITDTVRAMKHERDLGLHERYDADGNKVEITDQEITERAEASALNQPAFAKANTKAIASLMVLSKARNAHSEVKGGSALPRDPGTGLAMPSAQLNERLDVTLEVGRAVLADAKREFDRTATPQVRAAVDAIAARDRLKPSLQAARDAGDVLRAGNGPVDVTTLDGTVHHISTFREMYDLEDSIRAQMRSHRDVADAGQRQIAAHQQQVLLGILGRQRGFGTVGHQSAVSKRDSTADASWKVTDPRPDSAERLAAAEKFFPDAWLTRHAAQPLTVGASGRAYYQSSRNHISFSATRRDKDFYDGGFSDATAEVAVHELGHRMEQVVPGLTALEFAFVRRRAARGDGSVEPVEKLPGYGKDEVGQKDDWARPYAGKSYESQWTGRGPHEASWEVFQVGLQDTFGRGTTTYGRKDDPEELQAFVIGALLTLG